MSVTVVLPAELVKGDRFLDAYYGRTRTLIVTGKPALIKASPHRPRAEVVVPVRLAGEVWLFADEPVVKVEKS